MQNRKIQFLTVCVIALAIINIALIGFMLINRPIHLGPNNRFKGNRGAHFLENRLGYDENQKENFQEIFDAHRHRRDSIENLIRKEKHEMIISLINDKSDSSSLAQHIHILSELHEANEREFYNHFKELKKISSKDQLNKLHDIIQRTRK